MPVPLKHNTLISSMTREVDFLMPVPRGIHCDQLSPFSKVFLTSSAVKIKVCVVRYRDFGVRFYSSQSGTSNASEFGRLLLMLWHISDSVGTEGKLPVSTVSSEISSNPAGFLQINDRLASGHLFFTLNFQSSCCEFMCRQLQQSL